MSAGLFFFVRPSLGAWADRAACRGRDVNVWFPAPGEEHAAPAKAICGRCPVRVECLDYAVAASEAFGIWGGQGSEERPPGPLRHRLRVVL